MTAVDVDRVASAVAEVIDHLDRLGCIEVARVSGAYTHPAEPGVWRCAVYVRGPWRDDSGWTAVAWQPRFASCEDALAYREAVTDAIERVA